MIIIYIKLRSLKQLDSSHNEAIPVKHPKTDQSGTTNHFFHHTSHTTKSKLPKATGSSRLLTTMASLPFLYYVLFPIDLRYGWDVRLKRHQELLAWIDSQLRPLCTTFEPRCKYWSRAGNSRDPAVTKSCATTKHPC